MRPFPLLDNEEKRVLDCLVRLAFSRRSTSPRELANELGFTEAKLREVMHGLELKGIVEHHPKCCS